MARPRKYINRHMLKELCQAQLSNDEISRVLRVSWDTLERRYAEPIKAWRSLGPASVRRELYRTAIGDSKGKVPSMIFFLKNYGGMSDKLEHTGNIKHEHFDFSTISDEQLRAVEALIDSASSPSESRANQG